MLNDKHLLHISKFSVKINKIMSDVFMLSNKESALIKVLLFHVNIRLR